MKSIFTILSLLITSMLFSQTILFQENFEGATLGMTSSNTGSGAWGLNTRIQAQGLKSDSATVSTGDSIYLTTTNSFSAVGKSSVYLSFSHIAKVEFNDSCVVEVSSNGGTTWSKLKGGQYMGTGQFANIGNRFTSASYGTDWQFTAANAVPQNTWWKHEVFNISALVGGAANVKIRFKLVDGNNNGGGGNAGWFLDSIMVVGSFSELIPPSITLIPPVLGGVSAIDTVYGSGPFDITAHITDNSGIDTAIVIYQTSTGVFDTLGMSTIATDTFQASIPFYGFGRSISYYVKAIDGSAAHNADSTALRTFFCKYSTGGNVVIGTGTSTNGSSYYPTPYGNYFWGNKTQYIILASEMSNAGAGPITSVAFDVANVNSCPNLQNFEIKIGTTTMTSLTSFVPNSNMTTVLSIPTGYQPVSGWNTHTLTTPFNWDGTSNIVIQVCSNNSGWVSSGNASVRYTTTTFANSSRYYRTDASGVCNTTSSGTAGNQRANISLVIQGASSLTNDIGVNAITNPTGGVTAGTAMPVNVTIKNFGVDTITYAKIKWKYDGVIQNPLYTFSDSLKADSVSSIITLATLNPTVGAHTITAWTEDPDSVADFNYANDSSSINFFACASLLNGTYTINPSGSGSTNYASFSDAVLALSQCGINGPVVFNVANGTYTEQIVIPPVNGSSSTNTITFQSASGDSSLVIMKYNAANASNNYVVKLDGTSYIKFKGINFQANDSTFARVFDLTNSVHDFTLENNIIETTVRALADDDKMIPICGLDSVGSNILIQNNAITNGSFAIELLASTSASNWKIKNNLIHGNYGKGIHLMYANGAEISGNEIYQDSSFSAPIYYGIYLENNSGTPIIKMNKVLSRVSQLAFGIRMNNCSFSASSRGKIYNNFFNLHANSSSTTTTTGILVYNTPNLDIFYNNVLIRGAQTNSAAIYLYGTTTDSTILTNNIFTNSAGGYAFYTVSVGNTMFSNNYNDLYTFGGARFAKITTTVCADLTAFQTATADGANSISYNPYFMNAADLHIANNLMNGTGTPLVGYPTDIDGDLRNTTTPDIGADEFDPSPWDATVLTYNTPFDSCGLDSFTVVSVKIKNLGSGTINGNFTASYTWPGKSSIVTESISTVMQTGDTLDYVFTTYANLDMASFGADSTFAFTAWVTLQGDPVHFNDTVNWDVNSKYQPPAPVTQTMSVNYGSPATLTATSNDSLTWWAYDTSSTELANTNTYVTQPLWDTTTFYVSAGGAASADSLTTTFAGGNGSTGNMFDITAFNTITIDSFYMNGSSNSLVEVWYRPGTYVGHTTSNAGWTKLGDYTVTSAGLNNPTRLPVGGLTIPAGQTYGIYVTYVSGSIAYTNGNGSNQTVQDANIKFHGGHGGSYFSLSFTPRVWNGRIFYSLGAGGSACSSQRIPLTVNVVNFPAVDAGIQSIVNPSGSIVSGTSQDIKVQLTNYGTGTMTSANIKWWINGQMQDSLQWIGSLTNGASDTVIIDTAKTFSGGMYNITAWTSFPNNAYDSITSNDTSAINFNACMQGVYTIGDTSTGTFDFPSFTSALSAIQNAGLCGNVVFNVDTGTYIEQLTIPSIFSSGPNTTVTFQSANGDSTGVILKYTPTSSASNYVLKLNGCDYFTFKNMTIKSGGGTYLGVVEISGGSTHNSFLNNVIETNVSTSSYARCIYSPNGNDNYTRIENNHVINGYYAIYMRGTSTASLEKGTIIKDNFIEGFYYYGVYTIYQDSVQILHNRIEDGSNSAYGYAIYVYYCDNETHIVGNTLDLNPSSYKYGMRIYYSDGTANKRGLIANNMISIGSGTSTNYGIYFYYSSQMDIVYNSVNITAGSSSSRAALLYVPSSTANVNFVNNVLRDSVGYTLYAQSYSGINNIDYNSYHTNGNYLAYWSGNKSNLAALQAASNKDVHSVDVDPQFFANNNLHMLSTQLSGMGTPLSVINVDIDGESRGTLSTTIGADEVPLLPIDIGVSQILNFPDTTLENQSLAVVVEISNYGTDTIYTFGIDYTVNNGTPVSYAYSDTLIPGGIDTVTLTPLSSPAGNSTICATTVLSTDSNLFNDGTCRNFFGVPTKDGAVTQIYSLDGGCGLTMDTVKIWILNMGVDTINATGQVSPTTVKYSSNGGLIVTETMSTVIAPGDSASYTFTNLIYLGTNNTVDSIYDVAAWIDFVGDNVSYNDTAYKQIESLHTPVDPTVVSPVSVPYATVGTATATSSDSLFWYDSPTATTEIGTGSSYTTPNPLYFDDTVYVEAKGGASAGVNIIGTGTASQNVAPCNGYYDYSWSSIIYDAADIPNAGQIDSISFQLANNVSSFTMLNQKIYMRHIPYSTQPSTAFPGTAGKTKVFDGTIVWNGSGWFTIVLNTPFVYNGVDNLEIYWENRDGSYLSGYPSFSSTSTSGKVIYRYTDNSFPNTAGYAYTSRPNLKFWATPTGCPSNRIPVIFDVGNQPPNDVGVISIDEPISAINLTNTETVKITVKNFGTAAQDTIPVAYQIGNLSPVIDTIFTTIASGATSTFTFASPANLGIAGNTYQVTAYTDLISDVNSMNDTLQKTVTNQLPNYCSCSATSGSYEDLTGISVGTWSFTNAATGAQYTDYTNVSPTAVVAPGLSYAVSVSSGLVPGYSYSYTCYTNVFIDFNRDGDFTDPGERVFGSSTNSNNTVSGTMNVPASALPGLTRMRVVLREGGIVTNTGPCGTFYWGEVEDYNIMVMNPISQDAGVELIINPNTLAATNTVPVDVRIRNYGTDTITSVDIAYELNSGTPVTMTYNTAPLAPMDSVDVSLGSISLQAGANSLCAYTILAGDSNAFNDQKCKNVFREAVVNLTYFDNFEGSDLWMPDTLLNQWQRGVPAMTSINTAHSPTNVWAIDLDSTYANNSADYLYSPRLITTGLDSAMLKFWHYYNTQSGSDGGAIQVAVNNGNWLNLGYMGDPLATNWYTSNIGGTHFWTGNSNGWVQSTYKINFSTFPFAGADTVQFRFYFYSNSSSNNYDGWAIDDFKVMLPPVPNDVGVISIDAPVDSTQIGTSNNDVTITVENFGTVSQTTIPVYYKINNGTAVSGTMNVTGGLAPGATAQFTFTQQFQSPITDYQLCAYTALPGDPYPGNDQTCETIRAAAAALDAGVSMIVTPADTAPLWTPNTVTVRIKNYGSTPLTTVDVQYYINTVSNAVTETWTGTALQIGDSVDFTFTQKYNSPVGFYQVCAKTLLANDADPANDLTCKTVLADGFEEHLENGMKLWQNVPNPAHGVTLVDYEIPSSGQIRFELVDVLGQSVMLVEEKQAAGRHQVKIDASKLASGVYYYTLEFDGYRLTKKMVVNN